VKITIETSAEGPNVTLGLTPKEFEDLKVVLKGVRTTNLTPTQHAVWDQLGRNLNRLSFGKV